MKLSDLEKLIQDTTTKVQETEALIAVMFKAGETAILKYDTRFLQRCSNSCYLTDVLSIDGLILELNDIKETYEDKSEDSTMIGLDMQFELSGGSYEGDSPEACIEIKWYKYEPLSENAIKGIVEREVKAILREKIYIRAKELGSKNGYTRDVDCKLLGLFKTEKIDFDTLVAISYSDCSI